MYQNLFRLSLALLFFSIYSCNSNTNNSSVATDNDNSVSTPFLLNSDDTKFSIVEVKDNPLFQEVRFKGSISFTNSSGYDFSHVTVDDASISITFPDNTTKEYPLFPSHSYKWQKNSNYVIGIQEAFLSNRPFLDFGYFMRTPISVSFHFSLNAINIDKEIPFTYRADILPKWKDFQAKNKLR